MRVVSTIIKTVVIAAIVIFATLNMQTVELQYFYGKEPINLPLFLIIIGSAFIGVILATMVALSEKMKTRREMNSLRKNLKEAEKEITRLRNLPLSKEKESTKEHAG
ncbi:MAG: LapA family protein [Flexistipes sinusarabici]|uniref:LapA family protein n=1 Tax=Flexistipes sinusarabici TaxID=2352 RepID=A0A5D0MRN5_FLESI|nr:LapA family protein [Flexistipes sinusarabici]TYB33599.1 MAG: LapA family protein [Flexistipes sinusarabici]